MKRIAKFEKVSFEQFLAGWGDTLGISDEKEIHDIYENIRLPRRATAGSAGYDFFAPADITLKPGENNTVGIIDSDYYYSDNEGHIFSKITNDSNEEKTVEIKAGEGFMQGIFVEYGITLDDDATEVRNGGFGSTTK